ncbi:MAG: VOC family protein [Armatimonas sp.]
MLLPRENVPNGYGTTNQFVIVKGGAARFIEFVKKVFDVQEREAVHTPDRDGTLIHAEVELGECTLMVADSKADWPFTPAFIQVYVEDAQEVLNRVQAESGEVVTRVSKFYGGFLLARFKDPFGNIWWLYQPDPDEKKYSESAASTDWHNKEPSDVYLTIMSAMTSLVAPG